MWVNIYCCLLACALSCPVTAGLTRKVVTEGAVLAVRCPHSVEGGVRWSRESGGSRADILTVDGDKTIKHINDPQKRYSSHTDGTLIIRRAAPSDSGRYFRNDEEAVELTVIPSGTIIRSVEEGDAILLKCPGDVGGSAVPTWRRDSGEMNEGRISVSTEDTTLSIREAEPADSGLYYCDGKPAVYLTVRPDRGKKTTTTTTTTRPTTTRPTTTTKTTRPTTTTTTPRPTTTTTPRPTTTTTTRPTTATTTTTRPTTTTTTTTRPTTTTAMTMITTRRPNTTTSPQENPAADHLCHMTVRTLIGLLCLIIMISITAVTWRKAGQMQKQKRDAAAESDL